MTVKFFPWNKWHGKEPNGSTRLRVLNLLPYWSDADLYKYGQKADVMIYQKVYWQPDWEYMKRFKGLQILDITDADWLEWAFIKQTVDLVDAITCPTENLANFIRQMTDKQVKVIPDRHDIKRVPPLKNHTGEAKKLVWFGYSHNSESLNQCMPFLERNNYHLTVISNRDPSHGFLVADKDKMQSKYTFVEYDDDKKFKELAKHDIFLNPAGNRSVDYFKSNNRTTTAWLAGLPEATTADDIIRLTSAEARNKEAHENYHKARQEYDCRLSVNEYKELINEIRNS